MTITRFFLDSFLLALVALGAGCTVGPSYEAPKPAMAPAFAETDGKEAALASRPEPGVEAVQRWWLTFHDPELDALVRRAVAGNRDLKIAASRVRQARIQRAIAAGGLWPTVDLTAGYNRGRGSENVDLPFGAGAPAATPSSSAASGRSPASDRAAADVAPAPAPAAPVGGAGGGNRPAGPTSPLGEGGLPGVTTDLYQAGFDASWEIDLFGGGRRTIEAAGAQVQAAEEAGRGTLVSLLGEVAESYLQLRAGQNRLELARQNIAVAQETLDIIRAKFEHGLATEMEVARQSAEFANRSAAVPALETAERLSIHALSVLVGEEPNALSRELSDAQPLPAMPGEVPVGLPSDLLRRRPDIRRAERELAGASARIGVATADLFPRFNLAAAFGLDSSRPGDLAQWSSHYYSVTPGVRWPILDWGRARSNVRLTDETEKEALTRYEAVVAQAVLDVENALVRFRGEQVSRTARADALAASREAFTIARQRYAHGLVDSLVVLDAQRSFISSEDALAQSDAAMRLNLVALYKALGGGWEG